MLHLLFVVPHVEQAEMNDSIAGDVARPSVQPWVKVPDEGSSHPPIFLK